MPALSIAVVFAAIVLPAGLYVWLALKERRHVHSLRDFFPLTRFLDGETYGRSTAAAGVSLATVILALVNLAPLLGISLVITIASYAISFVFLFFCARTILRANPHNDTLQAYLGKCYGSPAVRTIALAFSFVGYISIFSMELLVGVTVLQPFLGEWVLAFSLVYLLFIMVYSVISGFRAIVATEQWQIRLVIGGVLVLGAFLLLLWIGGPKHASFFDISRSIFSSWQAGWAFCLGIIVMNLPAPISDAGTWQRLCSTSTEHEARRGLLRAIPLFLLIWGSLIVLSCYIAQVAVANGDFDAQRSTLMTFILSSLATSGPLYLALLFVFVLGLFAAMITTADSLLLVAAQMFSLDLLGLTEARINDRQRLRRARVALVGISCVSFGMFAVFHWIRFDVVQLIFAIYGAQLALFPPVFAALFLNRWLNLNRLALGAASAILVGFAGAWMAAIYGKLSGKPDWLYNAPVLALCASAVVLALFSITARQRRT